MQLGSGGEYSLAVHHSDEEMQQWGLSPDMIAGQKWRAYAPRGANMEKLPWYLDGFLDHVSEDGDDDNDDDKNIENNVS
ncbi:hypothetical protein Hdeb2414_s0013g00418701 [Helianthus debilis subsp. tardiflorus]